MSDAPHVPLRPCGVCSQPAPDGNCPRHPKRGGYRPGRVRYPAHWRRISALVVAAARWRCAYCGGPGNTGDHVVPHSRGGRSEQRNAVCACSRCNTSKGARTLREWVHSGLAPEPAIRLLAQRIVEQLPV